MLRPVSQSLSFSSVRKQNVSLEKKNRILASIDDEWTHDATHMSSCTHEPDAHVPHHGGEELREYHKDQAVATSAANLSSKGKHLEQDLHV